MRVLKFGGSSLADFDCLQQVAQLVKAQLKDEMLLVLSAPGGMTDSLVALASAAEKGHDISQLWQALISRCDELKAAVEKEHGSIKNWPDFSELKNKLEGVALIQCCPEQVRAFVISFGERVSVSLMQNLLSSHDAVYLEATSCIASTGGYIDAEADLVTSKTRFQTVLKDHPSTIYIMPGFTASNDKGELTTLGRNGSDYSAAIAAACLDAEVCQIWTDVDGVYSADPRYIKKPLRLISYLIKKRWSFLILALKSFILKQSYLAPKLGCHVRLKILIILRLRVL